jgi:hypothetical protein
MRFQILMLSLIFFSQTSLAQGRKPAVEDFVGIEVEHPETIPQGTEGLFNFEKDIADYETTLNAEPNNKSPVISASYENAAKTWSMSTVIGVTTILILPLLSWLLVMLHMKRQATSESISNLKVLENYRKEKERAGKKDQETRKAS